MNLYKLGKSYEQPQGLQTEYFTYPTHVYGAQVGSIADNVFESAIQGVDSENWYEYTPILLRSIPAAGNATGELMSDDWQRIYIIQPAGLSYISPGAYLQYNNNWWIVFKPNNLSVGIGQAVVRRCNAEIRVLDFYGNIQSVPMSYAKMGTLGNASHPTENSIIAKNYINCICQYNDVSSAFRENTRMILGNMAYSMRGVNNFTREYTEDKDSVHIISFTIELTELLPQDDVENQVADGLAFSWEIVPTANSSMKSGATQLIGVQSVRNGEIIASTADKPIGYTFSSSDENVLTVSENGLVSAVSEGEAEITVSLIQNPSIQARVSISVSNAAEGLSFTRMVDEIHQLESAEISAVWTENGEATGDTVHFEFSGPSERSYETEQTAPNTYLIRCWALSDTPLTVTIHHKGESLSQNIRLRG